MGALAQVLEECRNHGIDLGSVAAYSADGQAVMVGVPKNFGMASQLASMAPQPVKTVDAFRVEGDDERGALCGVMNKLAAAGISATTVHAAAIEGKFAGVVYVAPEDVDKAAEALGL
ncbi:MAG TPA: hypothetical protein QGH10_25045 [Armatimonadota bacterium]|nr:hypothetical protein [Armatimonadota bacterium]